MRVWPQLDGVARGPLYAYRYDCVVAMDPPEKQRCIGSPKPGRVDAILISCLCHQADRFREVKGLLGDFEVDDCVAHAEGLVGDVKAVVQGERQPVG